MKRLTFFYHYNRPESRKRGHNVLTVHYRGVCHFVKKIKCFVYTETKERKHQPHCVIHGKCLSMNFNGDEVTIL